MNASVQDTANPATKVRRLWSWKFAFIPVWTENGPAVPPDVEAEEWVAAGAYDALAAVLAAALQDRDAWRTRSGELEEALEEIATWATEGVYRDTDPIREGNHPKGWNDALQVAAELARSGLVSKLMGAGPDAPPAPSSTKRPEAREGELKKVNGRWWSTPGFFANYTDPVALASEGGRASLYGPFGRQEEARAALPQSSSVPVEDEAAREWHTTAATTTLKRGPVGPFIHVDAGVLRTTAAEELAAALLSAVAEARRPEPAPVVPEGGGQWCSCASPEECENQSGRACVARNEPSDFELGGPETQPDSSGDKRPETQPGGPWVVGCGDGWFVERDALRVFVNGDAYHARAEADRLNETMGVSGRDEPEEASGQAGPYAIELNRLADEIVGLTKVTESDPNGYGATYNAAINDVLKIIASVSSGQETSR